MPPMSTGKPSPENPLTQLGLAVCTATYSRTDSVWTLSLPGSNSWKAGIHLLGEENFCDMEKPHTFGIVSMCVHTPLILLLSQCPTKVTEFPGQMHSTVQSTVGRRWCVGGRNDYLQSLGLSYLWKKHFLHLVLPWLLTGSNTCCQQCFTPCFPLALFLTLLTT